MTKGRIALFFVPFSLKISEKEESSFMEREAKIITHGSIDIEQLSEAEQRALLAMFSPCSRAPTFAVSLSAVVFICAPFGWAGICEQKYRYYP